MDLAKNDEQRTILKLIFGRQVMGRPFVAPPGVPKDRVDALRKAFDGHDGGHGLPGRGREGASSRSRRSPGEKIESLVQEVYRQYDAGARREGRCGDEVTGAIEPRDGVAEHDIQIAACRRGRLLSRC